MKTILFPTDFSANADNALSYAVHFCKALKAKLVLLNSCHVPAFASQVPMEAPTDEIIFAKSHDRLKKYRSNDLLKSKHIAVEEKVTFGPAVDNIIAEAQASKADLIVMGTKGASGLEEVLVGSNTSSVMEKATCPVVAIPGKAKFQGLKKIVFATDYHESDFAALNYLVSIATLFDSEIIIVHVFYSAETADYEKNILHAFKEKLKKEVIYKKLLYKSFVGADVADSLTAFVEENKVDMIALSMRRRNIITKLFNRSLTKKMAYHTEVPLMSLHF